MNCFEPIALVSFKGFLLFFSRSVVTCLYNQSRIFLSFHPTPPFQQHQLKGLTVTENMLASGLWRFNVCTPLYKTWQTKLVRLCQREKMWKFFDHSLIGCSKVNTKWVQRNSTQKLIEKIHKRAVAPIEKEDVRKKKKKKKPNEKEQMPRCKGKILTP